MVVIISKRSKYSVSLSKTEKDPQCIYIITSPIDGLYNLLNCMKEVIVNLVLIITKLIIRGIMKLKFKYTDDLVNYLIKIEKYKTAVDYLFLPTRKKTKIDGSKHHTPLFICE